MDSLSFSKSDLKFLLILSSVVPLLSFILGFYIAHSSGTASPDTILATKLPGNHGEAHKVWRDPTTEADALTARPTTLYKSQFAANTFTPVTKRYIVQAGLFTSVKNAKCLSRRLIRTGLTPHIVSESKNNASLFRVIVGSFDSEHDARSYSESIEKMHSIKLFVADTNLFKLRDLVAAL